MSICGIVAEYNPFHLGHEKHIALARRACGAKFIVCAMSGFFTQRGEPSIFDKWTRAACALSCGADAVIEIPLLTAVQSAQGFAQGGIKVLAAAGANSVCFGAETDDLSLLKNLAQTLDTENNDYKKALRQRLDAGQSFPRARMDAAGAPPEASQPGAILGIEYLKALRKYPDIKPYAIKREGAAYHCGDIGAYLPSATAIRTSFSQGDTARALAAMPEACAKFLKSRLGYGLVPVFPYQFDAPLLHILRLYGPSYIANMPDVTEGLENRIYAAAKCCRTRTELIERVKTKRYTYARISRILACALLNIKRDDVIAHNSSPVGHIRVLGIKNSKVLSALSSAASVPLITSGTPPYPAIDTAASDVWALSQSVAPFSNAGRDFSERLLTDF